MKLLTITLLTTCTLLCGCCGADCGTADASLDYAAINAQAAEQRGGMWRALNTSTSNTTFSLSTIVSYLPAGKYILEFQYASSSDDVKFRLVDREAVTLAANSSAISGLTAGSDQIGLVGEYFDASPETGRIVYDFDEKTH